MSKGHSDEFSKNGGKCQKLVLTNFKKWSKMSYGLFDKCWKNGGKYSKIILTNFHKGGKCPSVILAVFQNQCEKSYSFGRIKSGV